MNDKDLEKVFSHIETYNREMGIVRTDIKWIKEKLHYLVKSANRLPTWATVLISVLMATIGWLVK